MRKILSLLLDYAFILCFGTLIGLIIYIQYFGSISLVAGTSQTLTRETILFGVFKTLPIIYLLLPLAMMLYKSRHRHNPVVSIITYSLLCIFTWLLLFPLTLTIQKKVYAVLPSQEIQKYSEPLSAGYFRHTDGSLRYFVADSVDNTAKTVNVFDSANPTEHPFMAQTDVSANSQFSKESAPFRDPLIKKSMVDIPFFLPEIFESIKLHAGNAFYNGYITWLFYCSFALALCTLYGFIKMSSWPLVNVFTIFALTALVIFLNYAYFADFATGFRQFMHSLFYEGEKFNFFIRRGIELPLVLINFLLSLIFIVCGIIVTLVHRND